MLSQYATGKKMQYQFIVPFSLDRITPCIYCFIGLFTLSKELATGKLKKKKDSEVKKNSKRELTVIQEQKLCWVTVVFLLYVSYVQAVYTNGQNIYNVDNVA